MGNEKKKQTLNHQNKYFVIITTKITHSRYIKIIQKPTKILMQNILKNLKLKCTLKSEIQLIKL